MREIRFGLYISLALLAIPYHPLHAGAVANPGEALPVVVDAHNKLILVAVKGYDGEVARVLKFDLEVMGCKIVPEGNAAYLLENGTLLRTCRIQNTVFSGGGSGGRVEKRDWDNTLLWSYDFSDNNYHQHHDIEPMPNGNILVLCWEYKSSIDAIMAGRNPSALADNELWPTYIMEVQPQGNSGINIVWEWYLWRSEEYTSELQSRA